MVKEGSDCNATVGKRSRLGKIRKTDEEGHSPEVHISSSFTSWKFSSSMKFTMMFHDNGITLALAYFL